MGPDPAAACASASSAESQRLDPVPYRPTPKNESATLVARHRRRELFEPPHLRDLDRSCAAAAHNQTRAETSLGVAVSRFQMPDGRIDWMLSSSHPRWSTATARRLAALMWPAYELVEARTPAWCM